MNCWEKCPSGRTPVPYHRALNLRPWILSFSLARVVSSSRSLVQTVGSIGIAGERFLSVPLGISEESYVRVRRDPHTTWRGGNRGESSSRRSLRMILSPAHSRIFASARFGRTRKSSERALLLGVYRCRRQGSCSCRKSVFDTTLQLCHAVRLFSFRLITSRPDSRRSTITGIS